MRILYLFISLFLMAGLSAQERAAASFTMDDIRNWTGAGPNRSALAIQWITGDNPADPAVTDVHFLVWGYRWKDSEKPTGLDMIRAIAKSDPRLFVMLQAPDGSTIWGFGYNMNKNKPFVIINSKTSVTIKQEDFIDGIVSITANPDGFKPTDTADFWMGGWYDYYCTYYTASSGNIAPSTQEFSYSQMGANLRLLTDGSWDAWTSSPIDAATEPNIPPISRLMQAAEANGSPTSNEQLTATDASVFYKDQHLYLNNMKDYSCSIISITGKTINNFLVKEQMESRLLPLQKGFYILNGFNGKAKVTIKFVVK